VLAIAAAKLGFSSVVALDNDPEAIEATLTNTKANGVSLDARLADVLAASLPPVEVAVCNISLQALEELASGLECGTLVASGFLASDDLRLAGYSVVRRQEQADWAAVVARPERGGE
jgi:ribosomal protein L11 methyltransferase